MISGLIKFQMDSWITIEILVISVLIVCSAFFSLSETALLSVNKIRIRHLAETENKKAKILIRLLENPEQFLAAILIGWLRTLHYVISGNRVLR